MEPKKGKSIDEIDPYYEDKRALYTKLAETILISSFNYMNDFSKFMIGLNSMLLPAYLAILKISNVKPDFIILVPFFFQIITIVFFLFTVYPRTSKKEDQDKPLIFSPERILEIYQNSIDQKKKWGKLGTLSFLLYLSSIVIVSIRII